ncbi:MAG: hypothetical protein WAT76_09085, partial [Dokdonella sp.]
IFALRVAITGGAEFEPHLRVRSKRQCLPILVDCGIKLRVIGQGACQLLTKFEITRIPGNCILQERHSVCRSTPAAQHLPKQPHGSRVIGSQCHREVCGSLGTGKVIALQGPIAIVQEFPDVGGNAGRCCGFCHGHGSSWMGDVDAIAPLL